MVLWVKLEVGRRPGMVAILVRSGMAVSSGWWWRK